MESSGVFLTFDDADLEQRWWSWWQQKTVRKVELFGAWATAVTTATASIALFLSGRTLLEWPWLLALGVWFLEGAVQLSLLSWFEPLHRRLRDQLAFFLRGVLNPLISLWLRAMLHNRLAPWSEEVVSLVFHFFLVFGVADIMLDVLRYPLRFKDHLLVQGAVSLIWWVMDARLCKNWLGTEAQQNLVGVLCSGIGSLTTGVFFDCSSADLQNVCITGSLQVQMLLGSILTSAIVYIVESAARREFLAGEKDKDQ